MQNKKDMIDDKAFEQHAWQKMSKLLDQEMPVKRKKRFLPIFFWGSGIAAVLLVFLWMYTPSYKSSNSKPSLKEDTSVSEPIASSDFSTNESSISIISNNDEEEETPILVQKKSIQSVNKEFKVQPNPEVKNDVKTIVQDKSIAQHQVNKIYSNSINNQTIASENDVNNNRSIENDTSIPVNAIHPSYKIVYIDNKKIEAFEATLPNQLPKIELIPSNKKLSSFALRAGYGTSFNQQSNYHIGFDWQIGITNKWSFITGLQYRFFPKSNSTADNVRDVTGNSTQMDGSSLPETNDPEPESEMGDFNNDNTPTSILFNQLSYDRHALVLPLNIQYQMNQKWSLSTGFRMAYLFQHQNTNDVQNTSSFSNLTEDVFLDNAVEYWSNIGVQFNPVPRLGISVHYNRSWTPISNAYSGNLEVLSHKKNNFNHFFETSILYRF